MDLETVQQEIIDEFAIFEDWTERYKYIIELGKELPELDDKYKTDEYKIRGCQSNVWMHARLEDGILYFDADSDAHIVKGLTALLVRVLSGRKPEKIANADVHFIKDIGMDQHLSPTRSNGLAAMLKQMKLYGVAYKHKMEKEA